MARFSLLRYVEKAMSPHVLAEKCTTLSCNNYIVHLCRGSLLSQSNEHVWRLLRHDNVTFDDLKHAKACELM